MTGTVTAVTAKKDQVSDGKPVDMAPLFRAAWRHLGCAVLKHQRCGGYIDAMTAGRRWYCAYTHPGQEVLAAAGLQRAGFITFLPLFVARGDTRKTIVPLFPSYLFVGFDRDREVWTPIAHTRGVKTLFSTATKLPQPVPVGVVEALIERSAATGLIDDGPPETPAIAAGDTVRIVAGPLADLAGLCSKSAGDRVEILLGILRVTVARELVCLA